MSSKQIKSTDSQSFVRARDVSTVAENATDVRSKATGKDGSPLAVSEQSFPIFVVVKSKPTRKSNQCTEKVNSSGTNRSSLSSSSIRSGPSSDKDCVRKSTCDGAGTTDNSSAAVKMRKSSESLNRNVQLHKEQLHKEQLHKEVMSNAHTDDVIGATVTANTADACLSSLQYHPIKRKEFK